MIKETMDAETETEDKDFHELFLDELADIWNAEQQLTKALPELAKAAESGELKAALESHLKETHTQIARLERMFAFLGEEVRSKKCRAMEGLLEEATEMVEEMSETSALDTALIAAAQKVEHYEIASYGTLCAWAEAMGHVEVAELLQATLAEEKAADEKLTAIAESAAHARS